MNRYLVLYGANNEMFTCEAEDPAHAKEQFSDWADGQEGEANEILVCYPAEINTVIIGWLGSRECYVGMTQEEAFTQWEKEKGEQLGDFADGFVNEFKIVNGRFSAYDAWDA